MDNDNDTPAVPSELGRGDAAWWADKVGRPAIFRYHHGEEVDGIVTSVNDRYVFVRFGPSKASEACDPTMLRLPASTEGGEVDG